MQALIPLSSNASRNQSALGLRTRLGLISGKVLADHKGRQTLGAYFLRSMLSSLSRTPFDRGKRQMASMAISLGASNRVPCRRTLHAVRASLLASEARRLCIKDRGLVHGKRHAKTGGEIRQRRARSVRNPLDEG